MIRLIDAETLIEDIRDDRGAHQNNIDWAVGIVNRQKTVRAVPLTDYQSMERTVRKLCKALQEKDEEIKYP